MPKLFQKIVSTKEFCSLSQELMLKILNNVVPQLPQNTRVEETKNRNVPQPPLYIIDSDTDYDSDDDGDDVL